MLHHFALQYADVLASPLSPPLQLLTVYFNGPLNNQTLPVEDN